VTYSDRFRGTGLFVQKAERRLRFHFRNGTSSFVDEDVIFVDYSKCEGHCREVTPEGVLDICCYLIVVEDDEGVGRLKCVRYRTEPPYLNLQMSPCILPLSEGEVGESEEGCR
jgi:hypothetical protein